VVGILVEHKSRVHVLEGRYGTAVLQYITAVLRLWDSGTMVLTLYCDGPTAKVVNSRPGLKGDNKQSNNK